MYYGARYYDPALSRFITADTVYDAGPQGLNRYSYALNNPIRYNDPSGHFSLGSMFGNWKWPGADQVGAKMQAEAQGAAKGAVEGTVLFGTAALIAISASPDDVVVEAAQYAADKSGNKALSKAVMIGGLIFSIDDVASPRTWKKAKRAVKEAKEGISDLVSRIGRKKKKEGTATIREYGAMHWSVEVEYNGKRRHTHQDSWTEELPKVKDANEMSPGTVVTREGQIPLQDAEAARKYQDLQIQQGNNLGPYHLVENSCVSTVCDVLQAGEAVPPPPAKNGRDQWRYLRGVLMKQIIDVDNSITWISLVVEKNLIF